MKLAQISNTFVGLFGPRTKQYITQRQRNQHQPPDKQHQLPKLRTRRVSRHRHAPRKHQHPPNPTTSYRRSTNSLPRRVIRTGRFPHFAPNAARRYTHRSSRLPRTSTARLSPGRRFRKSSIEINNPISILLAVHNSSHHSFQYTMRRSLSSQLIIRRHPIPQLPRLNLLTLEIHRPILLIMRQHTITDHVTDTTRTLLQSKSTILNIPHTPHEHRQHTRNIAHRLILQRLKRPQQIIIHSSVIYALQ